MSDDHAVVIGAGVAGLLAARAASEHFRSVTVLDRDKLPARPATRRGVPQGRQLHAMVTRGAHALEGLFPGFGEELRAAGGRMGDAHNDFTWYLDGHRMAPAKSELYGWGASRPLIEHLIRTRVAALPNVRIMAPTEVLDLITDRRRTQVVGVRVLPADDDPYVLGADLVIDAGGRGSRALTWLDELGYPRPPQSRVQVDVVYVTRSYRLDQELLGPGSFGGMSVPFPGSPRGWALVPRENDEISVCLLGVGGAEPPTDDAGMLAYAEAVPGPEGADYLRRGTPVGGAMKMRFPAGVRNHFEKAGRQLAGYLVVGDALCTYDPVYGHGMTSAALQAYALSEALATAPRNLNRAFYRAAAKVVRTPWLLSAGSDLRFPEVAGRRPPGDRLIEAYLRRLRVAAATDPAVGHAFLRVAHLMDAPAALMSPAVVWRVLRAGNSQAAAHGRAAGDGATRR